MWQAFCSDIITETKPLRHSVGYYVLEGRYFRKTTMQLPEALKNCCLAQTHSGNWPYFNSQTKNRFT